MKNKVLGIAIIIVATIGVILSIYLISRTSVSGWPSLFASLFMILVGVVVYRKGVKAVVSAIHDGRPKDLR